MNKKTYLTLIYLVVFLLSLWSFEAKALQPDQGAHFAVSYAVSYMLSDLMFEPFQDRWAAFIFPLVITGLLGTFYEFANPGRDSWDDIKWNFGGAAAGAGINILLEF